MAWSISCLENSITFNEAGAVAFDAFAVDRSIDEASEREDGLYGVYFDPDHMEHMDFMWRDEVVDAMHIGKANGRALFGSLEGDDAGNFWGYEFKNGKMTKLTGSIEWARASSK